MKSLFGRVVLVSAVAFGSGLVARPVRAQEQAYYTYVSHWAVPRSQWAAFAKEEEASKATMQKLIADGTIVAWGTTEARVHQEDGYTHAEWFTATSRAALLKALEVEMASATNPSFVAATKHHDVLLHTFGHGGKTSPVAEGYLRVTMWKAKPGQGEALQAHLTKYLKPMLDSSVADGTILMYNLDEEDVHTSEPGAYNLAIIFPNGAAIDKFFAGVAQTEKQNPAVGQVLDSLTVEEAHRDTFSKVTAFQLK